MSRYQYEPREPAFEDYYRSVPRAQWEAEGNKGMKQTVEEVYARGRAAHSQEREREQPRGASAAVPESDSEAESSADNDYRVKYRRQVRRTRARSADSAKSSRRSGRSRSRGPGSRDKNDALVRYRSHSRRYEAGGLHGSETEEEEGYYSDEDERRRGSSSSKSSRSSVGGGGANNQALVLKPGHKHAQPCHEHCNDNANKPAGGWKAPRAFPLPGEDSDYDSDEDHKQRKRRQRKRMLYTGLAGVATVAACNNIYQNTKAHKTRKQMLAHGMVCESEAKVIRRKAMLEDVIALGIVAVGVNNVVKGWKRTTALKQQDAECHAKWEQKRSQRDERVAQLEAGQAH